MGYPFYVDEHVLIPRQDTETLAEEALKVLKPGMQVLDLCTGSGCILISLMKMCEGLYGTGSDISEEALEVARKNACRLEVNATFIRSSPVSYTHLDVYKRQMDNLRSDAKSPEPPALQNMQPRRPSVPSRFGQVMPPSREILYSFSP